MSGIEHANGHKPLSLSHLVDPNIGRAARPDPADYRFELPDVLRAVVQLRSQAPEDAFSSSYLGTEREGNAILVGEDNLFLTIGYLIAETDHIVLGSDGGEMTRAQVLAYDYETGFGLLRGGSSLGARPVALGETAGLREKDWAVAAARGGLENAIKAEIVSKREFAGYWEYLLDEAIFTAPPHPHWSGAALIDNDGRLVGLGSLFVQDASPGGGPSAGNMFIPIDLYRKTVDDLLRFGRRPGPSRPWLGIYSIEALGRVLITSISERGPCADSGLEAGDVVLSVNGADVASIAQMYRRIWDIGPAGSTVSLRLLRDGEVHTVEIVSADRENLMKSPRAH